jgi:hypothetical protein
MRVELVEVEDQAAMRRCLGHEIRNFLSTATLRQQGIFQPSFVKKGCWFVKNGSVCWAKGKTCLLRGNISDRLPVVAVTVHDQPPAADLENSLFRVCAFHKLWSQTNDCSDSTHPPLLGGFDTPIEGLPRNKRAIRRFSSSGLRLRPCLTVSISR